MNAIKNDALSITKAIEVLEAPLAEIPAYREPPVIVPDGGDIELLDDFISGVNSEFSSQVLERCEVVALNSDGFHEFQAWIKATIPFAAIWAGIKRYFGASRCSIKIRVRDEEVDISAASPEDAERLLRVTRLIVYHLEDQPKESKSEQAGG